VTLKDYRVESVTQGIDAMAHTRVTIQVHSGSENSRNSSTISAQGGMQERLFTGTGADEDIVVSSARAYVTALNKLIGFVASSQKAERHAKSKKDAQNNQSSVSESVTAA